MKNNQKEELLEKVKLKIAISIFQKEEKMIEKKMSKSMLKIAAVACCTIFSITGVIFAKEIGGLVKQFFGGSTSDGVEIAANNGYIYETNTEYQKADGIEVSVDSFLMDDNNFAINFRIRLNDKYNIENMLGMELYDLKIIDETGKKVFATHALEAEEMSVYKTEQEAKENYDAFCGGYGASVEIAGDNELLYHLSATRKGSVFPKSQKLYVTFSRIHIRKDKNEQPLNKWYKGKWEFELDVPEEMYNREVIIYKVNKCSDENTIVGDATLSNTAFRISIPISTTKKVDYELLQTNTPEIINDIMAFNTEYVETSDGKKFTVSWDGHNGYFIPPNKEQIESYQQSFNLTKYDATDKLTVHIFTNKGEEIIIEYEKVQ